MQSSSQSKAAADLATSNASAGDSILTLAAPVKSVGKKLNQSKAKSNHTSKVSIADNNTEVSVDGIQLDNSSVKDFVPKVLANKETSLLSDDSK